VFLKSAIEQSRGEIIEFTPLGKQRCGSQPIMITVPAAIRLPMHNILDEPFQIVPFLYDNLEPNLVCIRLKSMLPFEAFRVRVDIVAIKEAHDLKIFVSKHLGRVNGTWTAASVQ